MYDLPELADANAGFLRALRKLLISHGVDVADCAWDAASRGDRTD